MNEPRVSPKIGRNVFIAPTAWVGGDVTMGDECTVMYHVVIRGDVSAIRIGSRVNVQDAAVIHTKSGVPLEIGDDVSIAHRAVVHCRRVGEGTLIGIGAIVLDDAEIGKNCLIGAGAVIKRGMQIPDGKLVVGVPGRIVGDVPAEHRAYAERVVGTYRRLGREHAEGVYGRVEPRH